MEEFFNLLRGWNKSSSERAKLQHIYLFIIIVTLVISGLIALIDVDLGRRLIIIAGIALVAFLSNALVWALAQTYIFSRLGTRRSSKK